MLTKWAAPGLVVLVGLFGARVDARAGSVVVWQLDGTIDRVGETLIPGQFPSPNDAAIAAKLATLGVAPGALWTLQVSFGPDVVGVPTNSDPEVVYFTRSNPQFVFAAGAISASTSPGDSGDAAIAFFPSDGDSLAFSAPLTSDESDSLEAVCDSALLVLNTLDPDAFSRERLPAEPPPAASLTAGTRLLVTGTTIIPIDDFGDLVAFSIEGQIDQTSLVPEPGSESLVGVVALCLLRLLRRR
jgi:hypothetical protein